MALEAAGHGGTTVPRTVVGWLAPERQDHPPVGRARLGRHAPGHSLRPPGQATWRHRCSGVSGAVGSVAVALSGDRSPGAARFTGTWGRCPSPAPEPTVAPGHHLGDASCRGSLPVRRSHFGRAMATRTGRSTQPQDRHCLAGQSALFGRLHAFRPPETFCRLGSLAWSPSIQPAKRHRQRTTPRGDGAVLRCRFGLPPR